MAVLDVIPICKTKKERGCENNGYGFEFFLQPRPESEKTRCENNGYGFEFFCSLDLRVRKLDDLMLACRNVTVLFLEISSDIFCE